MSTRQPHTSTTGKPQVANATDRRTSDRRPDWADRWPELRTTLRKAHHTLTDQDLDYQPGQESSLYQRMGNRLGRSEQQARQLVEEAAQGQSNNPQDRATLKDQRDRTTGADQVKNETMAGKSKDTAPPPIRDHEDGDQRQERITNKPETHPGKKDDRPL